MTKIFKTLILCAFYSTYTNAQIKAYPIDGWHSKVGFSVKFSGLLPVSGQFDRIRGTILFDERNMANTSTTIHIDVSSINTGVEFRDNHLKQEDFFAMERYPKINFSSEKVVRKNDQWIILGTIKIRNNSKPVEIPIRLLHGEPADSWKNYRITLAGTFEINRLDFEIGKDQIGIGEKVSVNFIISARIFNTETIALFKREFGIKMIEKMLEGTKKSTLEQFHEFIKLNNKDAKNPDSFEFLYLYLKQNKLYRASKELAELYVEVFPKESNAYSTLGNAYFDENAYDKARTSFERALEYDSENTLAEEMLKRMQKVGNIEEQ